MTATNDASVTITRFRYLMLRVSSIHSETTIQFSKLRLYRGDDDNNCYNWCKDMTEFTDLFECVEAIRADGTRGSSGEEAVNALMGIGGASQGNDGTQYGKMCYINVTFPAYYVYDVDKAGIGRRIDVSAYDMWCWYTSNDTQKYPGRNMKDFDLYVSNDRTTWTLVGEAESVESVNRNYSVGYRGKFGFVYETSGGEQTQKTMKLQI